MSNPTLTPLELLEDFLHLNNIQLIKDNNIAETNEKAFIVKYFDNKAIIYAPERILDNKERRWVLLHEFYHDYVKNGYYGLNDSVTTKKVIEGKIKRRLVKDLIPYEELIYYLKQGYETWELAEKFFVPEQAIQEALKIYEGRIIEERF